MRFGDWPLRRKLTALMVLSSALGLLLAAVALIGYAWKSARTGAEQDLDTAARIVADNTAAALLFNDARAARETLSALRAKDGIERACLYTLEAGATALFAAYAPSGAPDCPADAESPVLDLSSLTVVVPVGLKDERVGRLRITQNLDRLEAGLRAQIALLLAILGASFAMSFVIAWVAQRLISQPLLQLAQTARRVSDSRDYRLRAQPAGRDEIGQLVDDFNEMLGHIAQRDEEVLRARDESVNEAQLKARANEALQQALERLKEAQEQLVQNEKLASLGALVAGVAHEINTPVGVGVTAASTLQGCAAELKHQHETGALRRSDLERFVAMADESTGIILRNLQRAAELIQSFKQVAVDQSSGERRRFELRGYIEEVLLSLGPKLKTTGHGVSLECPAGIKMEGYPGALAQILTNFVSNSILHGYEPGQHGHIAVNISEEGGWVTLRYSDDGRGIPKENLKRTFDPFFTTKRGSGGSGLGMHIVYNLVTQLLQGSIQVRSEAGQGAEFTVRFPVKLMRAAA